MLRYIFSAIAISTLLSCCTSNNEKTTNIETGTSQAMEETEKETTGTFTVDGKEYSGNIQIQKFGAAGKQNYSVLCQWNSEGAAFALLQITFVAEADAKTEGTIAVYDGSILPMTDSKPGVAAINLSGTGEPFGDKEYHGTDKTGSNIMVSKGKLSVENAKLFNSEGKAVTVTAHLNY